MRGPVRIVALLLLSVSLGWHWAALQSVGWASMFLDRVQRMSVGEALASTFDGHHPCRLCLAVREGRAAERPPAGTPLPTTSVTPKLDLVLGTVPPRLILRSADTRVAPSGPQFLEGRQDPPRLPPPRVA